MIEIFCYSLIGLSFTAVLHVLGSSVLFINAFKCEKGLFIYGLIASLLAAVALASSFLAGISLGLMLLTTVVLLLALSQPLLLIQPSSYGKHRQLWLSSNSALVALLAFILAKLAVPLVG